MKVLLTFRWIISEFTFLFIRLIYNDSYLAAHIIPCTVNYSVSNKNFTVFSGILVQAIHMRHMMWTFYKMLHLWFTGKNILRLLTLDIRGCHVVRITWYPWYQLKKCSWISKTLFQKSQDNLLGRCEKYMISFRVSNMYVWKALAPIIIYLYIRFNHRAVWWGAGDKCHNFRHALLTHSLQMEFGTTSSNKVQGISGWHSALLFWFFTFLLTFIY